MASPCSAQHALSTGTESETPAAAATDARAGLHRPARPQAPAQAGDWTQMADRFARALVSGDVAELARLYHPRLRFAVRTTGAVFGRDEALANFARMRAAVRQVEIDIVDRQPTPSGFVVQQVFAATSRDGRRVRVPMCLVFQLQRGQVIRIDEYFDPGAVSSLLDAPAA